jgi:hypothetical protein
MPVLYLHIGMPKTGTACLQSYLAENRESIYEAANIYYPLSGMHIKAAESSTFRMHRDLFPIVENTKFWDLLHEELQSKKDADIVLSEENISWRNCADINEDGLEFIKNFFPNHKISIVLYIRRFDDYLKSQYGEQLQWGSPGSYSSYFSLLYREKPFILFPSKLIEHCLRLVGEKNAILRLYDKTALHGGDIILDFFEALGLPFPLSYTGKEIVHPSLPAQSLSFLSNVVLPAAMDLKTRNLIKEKVYASYRYPTSSEVGADHLDEFEEEIAKIDACLPGYKALFDKRACSFSFPEADVEPHSLLVCSLLYTLLEKVDKQLGKTDGQEKSIAALAAKLEKESKAHQAQIKSSAALAAKLEKESKAHQAYNVQLLGEIKRALFPNLMQRLVLLGYRPILKLSLPRERYRVFRKTPEDFLTETDLPYVKRLRKTLRFFGPLPPTRKSGS